MPVAKQHMLGRMYGMVTEHNLHYPWSLVEQEHRALLVRIWLSCA